mmetsp:Transcript_90895/g.261947  ORF Transcript_90895/g.261947 Transcript_90895/m.261947 type:complete len:237 (-) Transcript_90895:840-1550(-)
MRAEGGERRIGARAAGSDAPARECGARDSDESPRILQRDHERHLHRALREHPCIGRDRNRQHAAELLRAQHRNWPCQCLGHARQPGAWGRAGETRMRLRAARAPHPPPTNDLDLAIAHLERPVAHRHRPGPRRVQVRRGVQRHVSSVSRLLVPLLDHPPVSHSDQKADSRRLCRGDLRGHACRLVLDLRGASRPRQQGPRPREWSDVDSARRLAERLRLVGRAVLGPRATAGHGLR